MPTLTSLMGLAKPAGGSGGDVDTWGTIYLNGDMDLLDAHDHTTGKGAPVKSGALRIDGDVQWNYGGSYFAILQARALGLKPVAASSVAGDANVLYVDSGASNNLYFKNQGGAAVRITSGNNLDITLVGGIVGDYTSAGAEVAFASIDDTYTFKQEGSPRPWAKMRCGDIDLYEAAATIANRIRLRSPAALAASYELVMPTALAASTKYLSVSPAGVLAIGTHGDRVKDISPLSGTGTNWSPNAAGYMISTGAGSLLVGIDLHVGERIKSISYQLFGDGTVNMTATARSLSSAMVSASIGAVTTLAQPASWSSITIDVTDTTIASLSGLFIEFAASGGNLRVGTICVTYDIP